MDCVFCKIAAKKIPADIIHEDDKVIVFKDINPSAEVHLLIVPKEHIENIEEVKSNHAQTILAMIQAVQKIVRKKKLRKYRLLINGGELLEVSHLHWHLQAGKFKY